MKIRNGFVSNSSSSSFVISAKSTMKVFNKMIPLIKKEYDDDKESVAAWQKYHAKKVDVFKKSHDETFNGGIIIPFTCNFETFIFPVKDGECYVESCNNHPWEEIFPDMFEDDSDYRHYSDDETIFTDVNTNTLITAKAFSNKRFGDVVNTFESVKEDVSCGFKIGLYMTNDECDHLNTRLQDEGYDLEDYRACTKFLLEQAGIDVTPDEKLGENKLTYGGN